MLNDTGEEIKTRANSPGFLYQGILQNPIGSIAKTMDITIISDIHGLHDRIKLTAGTVLIHAGDSSLPMVRPKES